MKVVHRGQLIMEYPSGRTECQICGRRMTVCEQVITGRIGSGNFPGQIHLRCFLEGNWDVIIELWKILSEGEREDLEQNTK